jgi:hypothetical protein
VLLVVVVVVVVAAGNSDRVGRHRTDIGLLLGRSLYVYHIHEAETGLATGTTQRRHMTNCCQKIRLNVTVPSDEN